MPELIDKYATMDAIPAPTDADEAEYYGKICDAIEAMPTIEPEMRHGRWVYDDKIGGLRYYQCENCRKNGNECIADEHEIKWFEFCPKCGARMGATVTNVGGNGGEQE